MHMTMRNRSFAGSSARRQGGPRGRQDTRNQGRSKKPRKRLYSAGKRCCNKSHSKQTRWQRGKRPLFQLKSNGKKKKALPSVSHKSSTFLISFFAMRSKRSAVETSSTNHVTVTKAVHRCLRENKSERKRKKSIKKLVIVYIALPSEKKKEK